MSTYNDVLDELQDYILDEENIKKSLRIKLFSEKNAKPIINKINTEKKSELFVPMQQDSLFWCYYIMKNGDSSYETLNNKNSLLAKQMKIELVSAIRKNKTIVKTYKFDTITNIESNLANDNALNIKTFFTLCAIENINVIFVSKKSYFELLMNDSNVIYIVHQLPNKSNHFCNYGFELAMEESLNNIRDTLYKLDNIDKPIKSMSAYKVEDLINISTKLAIEVINKDTGKHKSKKDLYESIIQYF
jgi:hypothetical protein